MLEMEYLCLISSDGTYFKHPISDISGESCEYNKNAGLYLTNPRINTKNFANDYPIKFLSSCKIYREKQDYFSKRKNDFEITRRKFHICHQGQQ